MAQIGTTTHADPLRYPAQPRLDKLTIDGGAFDDFYAVARTGSTTFEMYQSGDNGVSWSAKGTVTRSGLDEVGPMVAANDNNGYVVYRVNESSLDKIYARRFSFTSQSWGSEFLVGSVANGGVAGAVWSGLGMHVVTGHGSTQIVIAVGVQSGALQGARVMGCQVDSGGTFSQPTMFNGTSQWLPQTASGRVGPSCSVEHTGDYHTAPTPHLWVVFGRTNVYAVRLGWSSNNQWTGPSSATQIITGITATDGITGRWDGNRWLMPVQNPDDTSTVALYERDKANSTTTKRTSNTHTQGVIRHVTCSWDRTTGNTRIYAVGTSTPDIYYCDFIRASATFSSWVLLSSTDVLNVNNFGVRPGNADDTRYHVYRAVSGAPNTMQDDMQSISYAPLAPIWVAPATSGAAADVASSLLLDWTFVDPDPADTQGSYAVRRQIGAGALNYWRASDSTWQVAEVQNTSGTTSLSLAASWGAGGDANHTYWAKTWDAGGSASVYGDPMVVVPSVVVNPSITSPTPAEVLGTQTLTVTWTVSEETQFRIILSFNAGAQIYDSGWITSTALTYDVPVTLIDGGSYTVTLQTRNNEGLPSVIQTRNFTVSYLGPNTPTIVATPVPASGWIAVVVTNPTPSGGRPAVATNDLWRRETAVGGVGMLVVANIANGATYNDWHAVSGVAYEYQVVAVGTNGAVTLSAWTA